MSWLRRTPLDGVRWVVIDCETSGLDMARDRLLSVGALAVQHGRIRLGEAYTGGVRQTIASEPGNILIHGISGDAQLAGRPLEEVIGELQGFVADRIPVGFHARFDATILRRHGLRLRQDWVNLASLVPLLFPQHRPLESSLDYWLAQFAIAPHGRHDALGDAFSTSQLLLVVLTEAERQGIRTLEALRKLRRDVRWIGD